MKRMTWALAACIGLGILTTTGAANAESKVPVRTAQVSSDTAAQVELARYGRGWYGGRNWSGYRGYPRYYGYRNYYRPYYRPYYYGGYYRPYNRPYYYGYRPYYGYGPGVYFRF